MRVVILCSSLYSETSCALAARLARLGYAPAGVLSLPSLDLRTLVRKLGQWGSHEVVRYARNKLISRNGEATQLRNPYLAPFLKHETGYFRNLRAVAAHHSFPIVTCKDQNAPESIEQVKAWSPDLLVFTGGHILRNQLLDAARLGGINVHLGLLPEIRGMSSPEWSLLKGIPVGITIHSMDAGIDTGPILRRCEYTQAEQASSLDDLRNRLIAFGVDQVSEIVTGLDRGTVCAMPQPEVNEDHQYFVMHEWLQAQAAQRLKPGRLAATAVRVHG